MIALFTDYEYDTSGYNTHNLSLYLDVKILEFLPARGSYVSLPTSPDANQKTMYRIYKYKFFTLSIESNNYEAVIVYVDSYTDPLDMEFGSLEVSYDDELNSKIKQISRVSKIDSFLN